MLLGISLICVQAMNPILASALMPGLGELVQGERTKAHTFFIVEGAIWLSYAGFNYFGHKIDSDARAFAVQYASANATKHDEDYFDAVEKYFSSDDHNLEVERNASLFYPDDPVSQQEYIQENEYYREKRTEARENIRRASFMPGFAIINRVVSIVDVIMFSKHENFGLDSRPGKVGIYFKF
jgi:hypothetical protein